MGRTLSKNQYGEYQYGFQPINDYGETINLPVTSGQGFKKGDLAIITSGYLAIATTLANIEPDIYVVLSENTADEADGDGAIDAQVIPICDPRVRFMVHVAANTALVQASHVGVRYSLSGGTGAMGITLASAITADWGFMVEEIDISTDALAFKSLEFGFAIGRFMTSPETT